MVALSGSSMTFDDIIKIDLDLDLIWRFLNASRTDDITKVQYFSLEQLADSLEMSYLQQLHEVV